ncbi:MAG: glucose-6-phosphate dehydrogenase, partial [Methylococcales bacterium]|nr:glucose-6-phosphate dehydrogenase [Methylococcales bacterium]
NTMEVADYQKIQERLTAIDQQLEMPGNYIFYLSTPPALYPIIPNALAQFKLNEETENSWRRLVIEKPFGTDWKSAVELNQMINKDFREHQVFRIDHYLGKETVQNVFVFRFANAIFEPVWNRSYIDYVEITSSESIGIEDRGGYYDSSGAVCDMLQNHLLQVLALVAMESPASVDANSVRNEVVKVLQCIRPLTKDDLDKHLVLGQYTEASVRGQQYKSYREEDGVPHDSRTETYAAIKLHIDNWRWNEVPFYIRTGKRLPTRVTEVAIHFKKTPHPVFGHMTPANTLVMRIQPHEGILIGFGLKKPGAGFRSTSVNMNFHYEDLADEYVLSAYERLLLDCIQGDATLYARSDAVEICWQLIQPILDYRRDEGSLYHQGGNLYGYPAGTWGPEQSDEMMEKDGRSWRSPCKNTDNSEVCEL